MTKLLTFVELEHGEQLLQAAVDAPSDPQRLREFFGWLRQNLPALNEAHLQLHEMASALAWLTVAADSAVPIDKLCSVDSVLDYAKTLGWKE